MSQVFLSYSRHDDEPFVKQLYEDLTKNGIDVWWDRKTMESRGRTFLQELRDAIEASDRLIAVIGPKAVASDCVKVEWDHALLFAKGVIPILRMGDYNLVPPELAKLHCPNFLKERQYDEALEELLRIIREPLPKLGPFLTSIQSLPPNYIPRIEYLNQLKEMILADIFRPVVTTSTKQITALQGMGGTGKSVLAAAFARTTESRRAFNDGILWVTIGAENPDIIGGMRLVGTVLGDDPANYSSQKQAEASLSKVLSNKVCLIVLDDIWKVPHVTPFVNALGPRCRLLITTRNEDVVTSLGAQECKVDVLSEPEALKLMADWCEKDANSLPSESKGAAKECGHLPLALSMCGAMAKSGTAWSDILEALQEADLEYIETQLPNYPDPRLGRAFKVSIDFLSNEDPEAVKRYQELAIFPPDEFVPEAALATLWAHTGNFKKRNSGKLLTKLKDRALLRLDGEAPYRLISLHDLQLDYLRATVDDLPSLHNQLLEAYRKECGNKWSAGPEDDYFFEHLAFHMKEAGKKEELRKLLLDFEWMSAKLDKVYVIQKETGVKKPKVNSLIHDYDYLPGDKEIGLVQGAIKLSSNALFKDKTQLAGQLLGRLLCFPDNGIQLLLNQVRECKDGIRLLPIISSLKSPGGPLVRTLEGHGGRVSAVAITPDRKLAVSASSDGTLKVWDLENGEEKATLRGHNYSVKGVSITPDGRYAVLAGDKILKVLNLEENGKEITTLDERDNMVDAVAITPDGNYAVSGLSNGKLKLWDLEKGEEKAILKGHEGRVTAIAIAPNGKYAVSASSDKTLKCWDLDKGEEKTTLIGHNDWLKYDTLHDLVAVTPDGKYAVLASFTKLIVLNLENGEEITTLDGHEVLIHAVAITPDGKYAVSASFDKTLKCWDLGKREEKTIIKGHKSNVTAVAITSDGKYAISGSSDGTFKVWDLENGEEVTTLEGQRDMGREVAIAPDGKCAVSASADRTLLISNLKNGEEKTTLGRHDGLVTAVAITPDGKYAVSASYDNTLKVWNIENGEEKTTIKGLNTTLKGLSKVTAVAITPDGKYAVSTSSVFGTIKVWDLDKGEERTTLEGQLDMVEAVAITPDGKYAVSGSSDVLKFFDLEAGKEKSILEGHTSWVEAVAVTPDGKYAISASDDSTLKLWNLENGVIISNFIGDNSFRTCDITSDGEIVVAGDALGKMHFLRLDKPN